MGFRPHPERRPVLVAGASSGIGAATAEHLAAAGHPVALAARRVEKLQELADTIIAAGGEAVAVPLDVTDEQSVVDCVAKAEAALGELEIVVAGAGDLAVGLSYETSPEHFADQVNIHLTGAYRIYRAVIGGMIDRARGDFVFIGSDVVLHPRPWSSAYVAAKSGIDGLVATIQLELEGTGVRAGVVRPGQTLTGMGMNLDQKTTEDMLNDWIKHGLARHGNFLEPQHIALAVAAMVTMPRGAHMRAVEVEAEGAVSRDRATTPEDPQSTKDKGKPSMTATTASGLKKPHRVSGGEGEHGHLDELASDPISLFWRVREECGDVGMFQLADREVVLVSGAAANEEFFRAPEEDLDQAAAYPFMTPVFGEGVVFDASPEERSKAIHNSALKGAHMKQHAVTIPNEVERIIADWGDEGEIDLLDFFSELTLYTSSSCLIGRKFRERLSGHIAHLFHDLEKGTDPIAYVDYKADIESFRKRDEARAELVEFIQGVMDERVANPTEDKDDRDLMDVLVQVGFDANTITGMFISMMFAGHHTTSGTAAWTLIELLRNPDYMSRVYDELDEIYGDTPTGQRPEYTFAHTRQMPRLENALKEALRLHPPLIILMRVVQKDFHVEDYEISAGQSIAVSPAISNRLPEDFPDADTFDPDRYDKPRQEDLVNRWTWIPFGAGRHRCVGAQFAIMQLKAIFSVLFQNYEFEMLQPSESYRNDHSKMVVQLQQPCRVAYRKRQDR